MFASQLQLIDYTSSINKFPEKINNNNNNNNNNTSFINSNKNVLVKNETPIQYFQTKL